MPSSPLPSPRPSRATHAMAVLLLTALVGALLLIIPQAPPAHADVTAGGGDFVSFATDTRVLDTRNKIGVTTTTPMAAASQLAFPVLGVGSVPATGVSAVMVTVAALSPTAAMLFRVWPDDGSSTPAVSVLHSVAANPNISNTAVIPVAPNGKIRIYNSAGTTHAVVDVQGYFTTATTPTGTGGFTPITQTRVVDSRSDVGTTGGSIAPGGSRTITLATAGVPATATAVYINLLVPGATLNGSIGVAPGTAVTGGSVFNYVLGSSSSGMSVKLSGGKATFRNSAAAEAANIVVDIQGYFSPTSTVGGGFRPAVGRPLDTRTAGIPLAGGGQIDFQVGGAAGLPVQGVAGALLNIHTSNSNTVSAPFGAWPTGTARPGTSVNNNPGGVSRANLNIIQPGTDGKVTIRNLSTVEVHVYVEIQGWFADTPPTVAIEPNSPTTAFQATPASGETVRPIELAYTDNVGRLVAGHVPDPDALSGSFTEYTTLSGGETFSGTPAIAEQTNGLLTIAGQHTDSDVWAKTATAKSPPLWPADWTKLGGTIRSHLAIGKFSDGRLSLFGVDSNGALWVQSQATANAKFGTWQSLGDVDLSGTPVLVTNPAGVVQVFARNSTGNLVTATWSAAGVLSAWTSLANPGTALDDSGTPAVVVGTTTMRVFVRSPNGTIATQQQTTSGTWPATWQTIPGIVAAGRPAATLHPADGTHQIVVRAADGTLNWAAEITRNSGTWTTWESTFPGLTTDPSTFTWTNSNGDRWGVIFRKDGDQNVIGDFTDASPPALPAAAAAAQAKTSAKAAAPTEDAAPQFHPLKVAD